MYLLLTLPQINCTGQKPASGLLADLAPDAIAPSGHIRVKPTLQIDDDSLPNIFACGDVADTKAPNPNSRIASRQAEVVADNIVLAARGKKPCCTYEPAWGDGVIKLTLGLVRNTVSTSSHPWCIMDCDQARPIPALTVDVNRTAPSRTSGTASRSYCSPAGNPAWP